MQPTHRYDILVVLHRSTCTSLTASTECRGRLTVPNLSVIQSEAGKVYGAVGTELHKQVSVGGADDTVGTAAATVVFD